MNLGAFLIGRSTFSFDPLLEERLDFTGAAVICSSRSGVKKWKGDNFLKVRQSRRVALRLGLNPAPEWLIAQRPGMRKRQNRL